VTTYDSLAALTARHAWLRESLGAFELKVFSQNGEDGVLAELFERVGLTNRFFVEFGVEDGREGNAVLLADVAGWSGLFMEADEACFARLARKYDGVPHVVTRQASVTPANINALLDEAHVPDEPDLLSVDIDGQDYHVWAAVQRRARVVVIEYNSALAAGELLVEPPGHPGWNRTSGFGSSLDAVVALARAKGYTLVHLDLAGVNAFFVRDDLAAAALGTSRVVRRAPNYGLTGGSHPDPETPFPFLDLSGR
jgi:hypothetical protein